MQKPKKRTSPKKSMDWLEYINDLAPLVTPIGSRFQADIPEWKGPTDNSRSSDDPNTSRLLGTTVWAHPPHQNDNVPMKDKIGNGRHDCCNCSSLGSVQCVKLHVTEARRKLQSDLGPAFEIWKFNEMGDDVGKLWSSKQKKRFEELVEKNPLSEGKSFLKPAEETFISKNRKDIVSYYLNVHVPKRISMLTRSGCKIFDSDDEEIKEASTSSSRNSLKRSRSNHVDITELVKSHYLTGRR